MIILVRCDDRLIHGQFMTIITKEYKPDRVVVVDDVTASNSILRTVFEKAVPESMEGGVYTVEDSIEKIKTSMEDDSRTILLMKSPEVYLELLKRFDDLPKTLNIGPMSSRSGTISVHPSINVLPKEADAIKEAVDLGAEVYFQQVPSQNRIDWEDVKDKFN